jgi:hypothetical protein
MEIRIAAGNWDSATAMLGWLVQMILSEISGVPTSIESNMYGSSRDFYDREKHDRRDAVCTWASHNLDVLQSAVPATYPRVSQEKKHLAFGYVAIAFGGIATLIVLGIWQAVYRNRQKAANQYAQLDFLTFLLTGSFLVSLGSILLGFRASDWMCTAGAWFVYMGWYNLELVPLIVKVAAINRMMEAARELRRFVIKRGTLYKAVAFIEICLVVFLACWTGLDPPRQQAEYAIMTSSKTEYYEELIAEKRFCCSGGASRAWQFSAVGWNALLLVCASVLAFQSLNVLPQ